MAAGGWWAAGSQCLPACLSLSSLSGLAQTLPLEKLHIDSECRGPHLDLSFSFFVSKVEL